MSNNHFANFKQFKFTIKEILKVTSTILKNNRIE